MKSKELKSAEERRNELASQIANEVALLKENDPDKELKKEFEIASLYDLQKHLDD